MARIELEDIPKQPNDVEDYLCALFHAAGWCVESGVVLRDAGVEILEIDTRAVQIEPHKRTVVLSEAKSGGWGAPDLFKLLGWQSYLGADSSVFGSTKASDEITEPLRRHAEAAGVTLLHLGDATTTFAQFGEAGLGRPEEGEVALWRLAALVDRQYRSIIGEQVKARRADPGPTALKEYHRLVGDHVLFVPDPIDQATMLYAAHDEQPRLTLSLADELDGLGFDALVQPHTSRRLIGAMRSGSDPILHCSMWVGYRARLALLRAAVEATIERSIRQEPTTGWTLLSLRSSFDSGMDWLAAQPTFWRYPALWEQFCWTWGGFLLADRLDQEYELLSAGSGVPVKEIPTALEALDHLFPNPGGWFVTPGPTNARRLALFPFHFHGIGAFRRRIQGWSPPPDSPADHTGADVIRWHNAAVALIGS